MEIVRVRVENFKGLRDIAMPVSRFACLIGENNAGKSSVLQAISLFFSGSALPRAHYFEADKSLRITIDFEGISDGDIDRLAEEHRARIKGIARDGKLTLIRVYGAEGKGVLKYGRLVPMDARFSQSSVEELLKGKKAGKALADAVVAKFPELAGKVTASTGKGEVESAIWGVADALPETHKTPGEADLPTGIDKSITAMLPEPIYIAAVKDLRDDVKTTESTPFGKVLGMLLKAIEPQLAQEKSLFDTLNAKLNRVTHDDGSENDDRLPQVKLIEQTVERFVQDSFRTVKLRIAVPPPELKAVLSSAQIYADDGVDGLIESKGDGLRRAIVFAILRAFVELGRTGVMSAATATSAPEPRYLLLFEEPELYLHPKAQQVLFDALQAFSQKHPVVVTTHSPSFFSPRATTTFVKIRKMQDAAVASKPYAEVHPVDLRDTNARDQFQIICYENNNIAFFADTVVLVEGDSDYIVLPHLARLLNPQWDFGSMPVRFARVGGKSNIRRYREFFGRFKAHVLVVTDLDFILGSEFGQVDPTDEVKTLRSQLLAAADDVIARAGGPPEPSAARTKDAHSRGDLRALWRQAREAHAAHKAGNESMEVVSAAVDGFFAWEKYWARLDVLKQPPSEAIRGLKTQLLDRLRLAGVCVWEKGAIEDYYPEGTIGDSKPAQAQCFCNVVTTKEHVLSLCSQGHKCHRGTTTSEFEAVFQTLFGWAEGGLAHGKQ